MIFTSGIISSSIGIIGLGLLELKLGQCVTRLVCNFCTTLGLLLLSLYRISGYFLVAGWTIMSMPVVYYITSNCNMVPFFPKISGMLVVMVSAVFDMSTGLFLIFKLIYQQYQVDLSIMLQILTALSLTLWLRTLCLMPLDRTNQVKTLYQQSAFAQYRRFKDVGLKNRTLDLWSELKPVICSKNTWQFCVYYTGNFDQLEILYNKSVKVISMRLKSIQGWMYPWLDWTYSGTNSSTIVSDQLNIYGYTYFMSPLIAFFPGLLSMIILKIRDDQHFANLCQGKI